VVLYNYYITERDIITVKKFIITLSALILVIALCSCGASKETENGSTEGTETVMSTEAETTETTETEASTEALPPESEIYLMKVGPASTSMSDPSFTITMYADENGNDNLEIDDYATVDISKYVETDNSGLITLKDTFKYYTVIDGVIEDGGIGNVSEGNMLIVSYVKDDLGEYSTSIYIYK